MAKRKKVRKVSTGKHYAVKTSKTKPVRNKQKKENKKVSKPTKIEMYRDNNSGIFENKSNINKKSINTENSEKRKKITQTESVAANRQKKSQFRSSGTKDRTAQGSNGSNTKSKRPNSKNTFRVMKKSGSGLSVVTGRKAAIKRKTVSFYSIIAIIIISVIVFSAATPTGPFEYIGNRFKTIGTGKFPSSVVGSETVSLQSSKNNAFLLSDSHLCGYNSKGKKFFEYQHNFSSPILKTSSERCLIFNRESTDYVVLNNSGKIYNKKLDNMIYSADISDSGAVAFATKATGYSAEVKVLNKRMKQKFSWFLADGLVSDVALSENGKNVAVSVIKVENGIYKSTVLCFNIKSVNPLFKIECENECVMSLESVSDKCFAYTTEHDAVFINWKNGTKITSSDGKLPLSFFKKCSSGAVAVFGKNTSSVVNVYRKNGNLIKTFNYDGLIDDISTNGENVYLLKNNKISVYSIKKEESRSFLTSRTSEFLTALKNEVVFADNSELSKNK